MSLVKRLKGRDKIQYVFKEGRSTFFFPVKIIWLKKTEQVSVPTIEVSIWVPKRNIRKAVDRNKIKRRIRAALQKHETTLIGNDSNMFECICIYVAKDVLDFNIIENAVYKSGKIIHKKLITPE